MLPISILKKTSSCILYEIPPGKPNPEQRCTTGEDERDRIEQLAMKGAACWYYVFNYIRLRIGKDPCEELREERENEAICSQRRKEQTAYDDAFPVSIAELYSISDMSLLQRLDVKNAQEFLNSELSSSCNLSEPLEGRSSIVPYIQEFVEQNKHSNMREFLLFKRASKMIEINMKFLSNFNTDVYKMTESKQWNKWDTEQKAAVLDTYVRDFSADLYKLNKSSWKPSREIKEGIDELINELKKHGPLMILGDFGPSAYIDQPFKTKEKISSRNIYAWRPGARRIESMAGHSILLVGAKKTHDNAYVYFIDPIDPSDPLDRDKQKIYAMSFKNLTSNICSLTGHKELNSEIGYAYHGNFKVSTTI